MKRTQGISFISAASSALTLARSLFFPSPSISSKTKDKVYANRERNFSLSSTSEEREPARDEEERNII
jgi:hypothetical protein